MLIRTGRHYMCIVLLFAELTEQHYFHHPSVRLAGGDSNEAQSADQVAAPSFPLHVRYFFGTLLVYLDASS